MRWWRRWMRPFDICARNCGSNALRDGHLALHCANAGNAPNGIDRCATLGDVWAHQKFEHHYVQPQRRPERACGICRFFGPRCRGQIPRRPVFPIPDHFLQHPAVVPADHPYADARPDARPSSPGASLVGCPAHRRWGGHRHLGVLRIFRPAAGPNLRRHLRHPAADHGSVHPDLGRNRCAFGVGSR